MAEKVLMLGSRWHEANASAASTRVLHLAASLRAVGYEVIFSADARLDEAATELDRQGFRCFRLAPNDALFDVFLQEQRPDIVIFDRFSTEEKFGWRFKQTLPECIRILDTIDLHFLRKSREKLLELEGASPHDWQLIRLHAQGLVEREVASIYRCDLSLVISDYEYRVLTERCGVPARLLQLCRLSYPKPNSTASFSKRVGFIQIGNFYHPPNRDALCWLRDSIWPLIRKALPDVSVTVWGAGPQLQVQQLTQKERGFFVGGRVADQYEVLTNARVNLAPLRFGAGIKGKIADGWFVGTPTVTTSIGAEGMVGELAFGGLIAERSEDIAAAAIKLYQCEQLWTEKALAAQTIIEQLYSESATTTSFLERLLSYQSHKTQERQENFTGQMLWQQGFRSTEFFSRWLELKKNKIEEKTHG